MEIVRAVLCLLLVCAANLSHAATKYVSPSGAAAWGACTTVAVPCSQATARTNAASGDIIEFADGAYTGGLDMNTNGTCTAWTDPDTSKIIWKSTNPGGAVISGSPAAFTTTTIFSDNNCNIVDGFRVYVPDQANSTRGIYLSGVRNEVRNVEVLYDGTLVPTTGNAHADGIVARGLSWIHDNVIHGVTVGITIQGNGGSTLPHATIAEDNLIHTLTAGDKEDADCFSAQTNSAVEGNYAGAEIRRNECHHWYDDAVDLFDTKNILVSGNYFHDPYATDVGHGACLKPGYTSSGQEFRGNRCLGLPPLAYGIDAQGATLATFNGNIVEGGKYGIYAQPSGAGTGSANRYTNNTIVESSVYAVFLADAASTGTHLANNILHGGSGQDMNITAGGAISGDTNMFFNSDSTVGAGTYSGAHDLVVDPLLTADFKLSITSTARRAGLATGACRDARDRVCPPDAPHIGAYQSSSGDPAATRAVRN